MEEIELLKLLDSALARCIDSPCIAVAFSGGLDSALIAHLAKKYARIKAYTVGVSGSSDLVWGERASGLLQIPHQKIELDEKEVIALAHEFAQLTGVISPFVQSYELPVFAVLSFAEERLVLTGSGADELFGGYRRYLDLGNDLEQELKKDFEKAVAERRIESKVAERFGKRIVSPYMDESIVAFAFSLPKELKVNAGQRKVLLRACAKAAGLPREIYEREKKAAQYSSGILKILRKSVF